MCPHLGHKITSAQHGAISLPGHARPKGGKWDTRSSGSRAMLARRICPRRGAKGPINAFCLCGGNLPPKSGDIGGAHCWPHCPKTSGSLAGCLSLLGDSMGKATNCTASWGKTHTVRHQPAGVGANIGVATHYVLLATAQATNYKSALAGAKPRCLAAL